MSNINLNTILCMVFIPFVFVVSIIPIIKKIAFHVGALDIPNARKVHTKPMPRMGGLGIYSGFLLGYMIFGEHTAIMNSILIGSFVIIITGILDDIKPLKASHKLVGQILAAIIVVFYGNLLLRDVSFLGFYIDFKIFAYPITILFILGCINCMNLIDGLDGLASGISSIFFLTIGIIAYYQGRIGLSVVITFIMLGSTLGFLAHNFYPAKIFMGDTGSLALGATMGCIAILTRHELLLILICIVFVIETLTCIIQRVYYKFTKKRLFLMTPIHHSFEKKGYNEREIVKIFCLIGILASMISIIFGVIL